MRCQLDQGPGQGQGQVTSGRMWRFVTTTRSLQQLQVKAK